MSVYLVLQRLRAALLAQDYEKMYSIPSRCRPLALAYEPVNLYNCITGRRNVFNFTAMPWLYRGLASLTGHTVALHLYTLFQMKQSLPRIAVEYALGAELTQVCLDVGVLEDHGGQVWSTLRISPVGGGKLLFSDMEVSLLRNRSARGVYIGRDSYVFMEWLRRNLIGRHFRSALDLCCGTGIQTFVGASVAERALGSDVRPNAVRWAQRNAALNGITNVTFVVSDRLTNIEGQFDLFTVNFPYDFGQEYGIEFTMDIMRQLDRYLLPNGEFYGNTISWIDARRRDVLAEAIQTQLRAVPLDIELMPIQYFLNLSNREYVERMGIVKGIWYLIRAKKRRDGILSSKLQPMHPVRAVLWNFYVAVTRAENNIGRLRSGLRRNQ